MRTLLVCVMFLVAGAVAGGVAKRATAVHTYQSQEAERFVIATWAHAAGSSTTTLANALASAPFLLDGTDNLVIVECADSVAAVSAALDAYSVDPSNVRRLPDLGVLNARHEWLPLDWDFRGIVALVTVESNIGYDEYGCIWIGQAGLVLPIRAGE